MSTALAPIPVEEVVDYRTRDNWLAARKSGVGASDSAALFGMSPWKSRFSLWVDKATSTPPTLRRPEDLERMEWGHLLEGVVAQRYESVTKRQLWGFSDYCIARHPRIPCMFATPDRWIISAPDRPGEGILQIKCSSDTEGWQYGPPVYVQCQVQHELAVTGRQWAAVAVLLNGNRMEHWDLDRNEAFISELEEQCQAFWVDVASGIAPRPDPHPATLEALKRLHPLDNGQTIELGAEVLEWADALKAARAEASAAEERADALEARIREAMGAFTYATLPGGRMLSLKHQTNAARTQIVPETTFRVLRELKAGGRLAKAAPAPTVKRGDR